MFKRILQYLIVSAVLLTSPALAQTLEQKAYNAGVVVFAQIDGQIRSICSGAAIAQGIESYLILTAGHCVAKLTNDGKTILYSDLLFIGPNTDVNLISEATVVTFGDLAKGQDFAILISKSASKFEILKLQDSSVTLSEPLLVVGAPMGIGKILLHGYVAEEHTEFYSRWPTGFLMQVPNIFDGSSGGPVVCEKTGEICGIVVGMIENGTSIAIPVKEAGKYAFGE